MRRLILLAFLLAACGHRPYTSLHLSFTDEAGNPLQLSFQLWRLDLPEDETWTAGDAEVVEKTLPANGEWLELEPGRYRVYSPYLRAGAADPPAFTVARGENHKTLILPTCRVRRLFVKVVDEHGQPVERAVFDQGVSSGSMGRIGQEPPWAKRRQRKAGGFRSPNGGVTGGGYPQPERPVVAGPRGFDLGEDREASRASDFRCTHILKIEGCEWIWVKRTRESRAFDLVALAIREETIERNVFLPSGAPAERVRTRVGAAPEGAREFPIRIEVKGYEGTAFPLVRLLAVGRG